jgi:alanyl-tRNA synthetase
MDTQETIRTFTEFFRDRGHALIEGSTLIPAAGDPVLFTTAGMHPLTRFLTGAPHPQGRRLVGLQRCARTTDLDEVGDPIHLTVFGMLGSWSLGDYDGQQSLRWGVELLRDGFGLPVSRLYGTTFAGDGLVQPDSAAAWTLGELGIPVEQLTEANWWSNGPTGPCGPDAEIFVWAGQGSPSGTPSTDCRWMELWNHVTMRYQRLDDGSLQPLPLVSVDTGMGLERLLMASHGVGSVFETDVFLPWLFALAQVWEPPTRSLRIVADHLRSAVVIIADGVRPSNTGRGYVLRRLVRRGLTELWRGETVSNGGGQRTLRDLPESLLLDTLARFGQPESAAGAVRDVLAAEELSFGQLLSRGRSLVARLYPSGRLGDDDYRYLHETHGLPRDLVEELTSQARAG